MRSNLRARFAGNAMMPSATSVYSDKSRKTAMDLRSIRMKAVYNLTKKYVMYNEMSRRTK